MDKKKLKLIIACGGIVILIIAIVLVLISTEKKKNKQEEEELKDGVEILGGVLPACSKEHLNDGDYEDTNTNIVFTNKNYKKDSKGNRVNDSSKIKKEHSKDGIVVKNVKIVSEKCREKYVTISATITNNTDKDLFEQSLAFDFVDSDNKKLNSPETVITVKKGETIDVSFEYGFRVIDASDYSLRLVYYP